MAKGDDAILKKRNKANRKKMNKDPTTVSARIAAIIAAKKRRKQGNRRMCEGMCFSLPSLDDPFNDRGTHSKKLKKPNKKDIKPKTMILKQQRQEEEEEDIKPTPMKKKMKLESVSFPSKFLLQCLNSIHRHFKQQQQQQQDAEEEEDEEDTLPPFFSYPWGIDFCKCYLIRNDILDAGGSSASVPQIAWIVSTAADEISRKEDQDNLILPSPFLLYLVPSQEAAAKVRSVCKPLKLHGIHTVSLHSAAAIDHQIHGLKSCEPEFIVSTPERLLELVSMQALDLSGVSFLVLDGVEPCHLDAMRSIRKSISGEPLTIVFNDYLNHASTIALRNLLTGPICRLSPNDSITCQSAYITQSVHVCAVEERKLLKGIKILNQACRRETGQLEVLFVVGKPSKIPKLVTALNSSGYSVSTDSNVDDSTYIKNRKTKPVVSVIDMRHISTIDIEEYGLVIILDFTPPINNYVQKILPKMARHTTNGKLHIIMTGEDASLVAEPLIQNLEACGQEVPEALRNLCPISPMMEE